MDITIGKTNRKYPNRDEFFPKTIETNRLSMMRVDVDQTPVRRFTDLFDSETTQYLEERPHSHHEQTIAYLEKLSEGAANGEKAGYVLRTRNADSDSGAFVGLATVGVDWERSAGKWGIILDENHRGKGYSAERAHACAELLFDHLDLDVVEMRCFAENEAAKSSIEGYLDDFGGKYVGELPNHTVTDQGVPKDCHLFVIEADQYEVARDG